MQRPGELLEEAISRSNYATVDKTGDHVLCGRPSCGTRMAEVWRYCEDRVWRHRDTVKVEGLSLAADVLAFLPGWAPASQTYDVWKLSSYARRRAKRGRAPKLRRFPGIESVFVTDVLVNSELRELPVAAICLSCGMANAISAEVVRINWVLVIPAPVR